MTSFRHLDGMVALLSELYEINERIMTGDICSAKTAIASDRMKKLLHHYAEALSEDGATKISLQAYAAAGGWVGITYSYDIDGFEVSGSQVPETRMKYALEIIGKLQAENARLKAEVERMASNERMKAIPVEAKLMDRLAELKAQVERLTKVGDKMADYLFDAPYPCRIFWHKWKDAKEGKDQP